MKDVNTIKGKKKFFQLSLLVISLISFIVGTIGYGVYWAFYDLDRLPTGIFSTEETSPDGKYTVKAYFVEGGSTVATSVRGELIDNGGNNKTKNIYWDYRKYRTNIIWIDNNTVKINGHLIDIPEGKFDWRHQ